MGGKWTIFRAMGEETIDSVVKLLKKSDFPLEGIQKSQTKHLKLIGSFTKKIDKTVIKKAEDLKEN